MSYTHTYDTAVSQATNQQESEAQRLLVVGGLRVISALRVDHELRLGVRHLCLRVVRLDVLLPRLSSSICEPIRIIFCNCTRRRGARRRGARTRRRGARRARLRGLEFARPTGEHHLVAVHSKILEEGLLHLATAVGAHGLQVLAILHLDVLRDARFAERVEARRRLVLQHEDARLVTMLASAEVAHLVRLHRLCIRPRTRLLDLVHLHA